MKHPSFDPFLPLSREVQEHLRHCPSCQAMWQMHQLLRAAPPVPPPADFLERFEKRLIREKQAPQAPRLWPLLRLGLVLLLIVVAGNALAPRPIWVRVIPELIVLLMDWAHSLLSFLYMAFILLEFLARHISPLFGLSLLSGGLLIFGIWCLSLRYAVQFTWSQMR